MKHDLSVYQLTDKEKADLIEKLTQDVTFVDEADLFETDSDQELFDLEAYLDDTDEVA